MSLSSSVDLLLIEDNPSDIELTLRALRKTNLLNTVHVAKDGQEALDYLFPRRASGGSDDRMLPRVILLDLKLPKLSGFEVLKAIKLDAKSKSIPVIVFSSSKEDGDIDAAYALGANSYAVKPLEFGDFMTLVGNLGRYWLLLNESPV